MKYLLIIAFLLPNSAAAFTQIELFLGCDKEIDCKFLRSLDGHEIQVESKPTLILSSSNIVSAKSSPEDSDQSWLKLEIDPQASSVLGQVTAQNIKRKLHIVIGDQIISSPLIQAPINSTTLR